MEADEMGMKVTDFHYTNISDVENRPIFEITVFFANPCWAPDEVNNPTLGEFCFAMVRPHAIAFHKTLS